VVEVAAAIRAGAAVAEERAHRAATLGHRVSAEIIEAVERTTIVIASARGAIEQTTEA
jgi:hypothetical protein